MSFWKSVHAIDREASVEVVNKKAGPGGVNRALKTSWCPIHFAVASGHKEVVKVNTHTRIK